MTMTVDDHVPAPPCTPFVRMPSALIENPELSDPAFRLLLALVSLRPRNDWTSDEVARGVGMGRDKTNRARLVMRAAGHWHHRKGYLPTTGKFREQRLASLTALRTRKEVDAGWAAAWEAALAGEDTEASRALGVRIVNSVPRQYPSMEQQEQ
jgi:hypothetical protein